MERENYSHSVDAIEPIPDILKIENWRAGKFKSDLQSPMERVEKLEKQIAELKEQYEKLYEKFNELEELMRLYSGN